MNKRINFYLPNFYHRYTLNTRLILLMREHPKWFRNNIRIGAIYGSFPGAIWNGGRLMTGITDRENIGETIIRINELGVPVRFTFTNCMLTQNHVHDTYCNLIMELANNGMNEVLVNSPVLEDYLRKRYPRFRYILSTTRCERDIEKINKACEKYDLVVADYRDNPDFGFLNRLKSKDRIELLVNAYCDPGCTMRAKHYKMLSEDQLNYVKTASFCGCAAMSRAFKDTLSFPTVIKAQQLYGPYVDAGFTNFKIEGRTVHAYDLIDSYVHYLAHPDHQDDVRCELTRYYWQ